MLVTDMHFFTSSVSSVTFSAQGLGLFPLILGDDTPNRGHVMDAKYFREKGELCRRLADGLSLNNPGRFQLMDLADDFLKRAKELEAQIRHEAA